jgi:hypothetical protein
MERLVQEFEAREENGTIHRLRVYQKLVDAGTQANPHAVVPGLKRIVTEKGETVNRLQKGKYQVVLTGILLYSDSPEAP